MFEDDEWEALQVKDLCQTQEKFDESSEIDQTTISSCLIG